MNPSPYLVALVTPLAAVAQETSQAETHLRSAWWAEKGANDFERALELYLRAVDASGPATVRADAAVRAGVMLHRLGRIQEALTALQSVQTRFPAEKGAVQQARRHLVELTAIDVEKDYAEWYRRHIFSEDVQTKILGIIRELASVNPRSKDGRERRDKLRKEILTYDRAALPALRETSLARSSTVAAIGMDLLADLGELPPAEAMVRSNAWADHPRAWMALLTMGSNDRATYLRPLRSRSDAVAKLARANFDQTMELLGSDVGGRLAKEEDGIPFALLEALMRVSHPEHVRRVVAMANDENVSLSMRRLVETAVIEGNWRGASAADWLEFSRNRFTHNARSESLRYAMLSLRSDEGDTLDAILANLDGTMPQLRNMTLGLALYGLNDNPVPLQLAWTPERLTKVIHLSAATDEGCGEFLMQFRMTPRGRDLLLASLFGQPSRIVSAFEGDDSYGELETLGYGSDESDEDLLEIQNTWTALVSDHILQTWGEWDLGDRMAAARLLYVGCAFVSLPAGAQLRKMLREEVRKGTGSDELDELLTELVGEDG